MDKQQKLDRIAQEIAETQGGPLKAPGVNPVPGEGNPDAKVLFIGEAPGFNENEQKRPFVGVSGKLLRRVMSENGFAEEDVFITNIVKFRPPENRDPTPQEIEYFKPFLDKQIEIIGPEVIVTLGRFSMYKFLGEGVGISRIHGQARIITWEGKSVTIFPMFHPAAALRDPSTMRAFKEDFSKLNELINKLEESKTSKTEAEIQQIKLI